MRETFCIAALRWLCMHILHFFTDLGYYFFSHNFFFLMLSCQRQRKQIMQIERTALGVAMHELSSTSDKQEDNQEIRNLCFLSPPLCQSL